MLPHRSQYSYNGDIVNFCFFTQTNKSQLFLNLLRVFYTSIFRRAIRSELQLIARYTSTVQIAVTWRLSKCLTMPRYIMTQCNVVYAGCNSGRVATLSRSGDVIQEINVMKPRFNHSVSTDGIIYLQTGLSVNSITTTMVCHGVACSMLPTAGSVSMWSKCQQAITWCTVDSNRVSWPASACVHSWTNDEYSRLWCDVARRHWTQSRNC